MERTAALVIGPFPLEFDAFTLNDGDNIVLKYLVFHIRRYHNLSPPRNLLVICSVKHGVLQKEIAYHPVKDFSL